MRNILHIGTLIAEVDNKLYPKMVINHVF